MRAPDRRRKRRVRRPTGSDSVSRGRFIVVEGAEGVGKSTQVGRLAAFLEQAGLPVVCGREPGQTSVGEGIRELLLHGNRSTLPPHTELHLILAARAAYVAEIVEPALAAGKWVVSDRFDLSTFAYQGYGTGIDAGRIASMNHDVTSGLTPDLYLVLDLSVEEGMARRAGEDRDWDRFESAGLAFLRRVRRGYVELTQSRENAVLVPAAGAPGEVEERIRREVVGAFPETFGGERV